jgi:hypothetical protein
MSTKELFIYSFHTGLLHKTAIDFLKMLARRTANIWKIPKVGVFNYYLRCLSCVLQKSNGNSINKRYLNLITGIMTDQSTTVYRSTYFESMMDSMNLSA